jgi:hypothetical protein
MRWVAGKPGPTRAQNHDTAPKAKNATAHRGKLARKTVGHGLAEARRKQLCRDSELRFGEAGKYPIAEGTMRAVRSPCGTQ